MIIGTIIGGPVGGVIGGLKPHFYALLVVDVYLYSYNCIIIILKYFFL